MYHEKKEKMYSVSENKKRQTPQTSADDITENQGFAFHVEHNKQSNNNLHNYKPLKYNMKKFKAITKTGIEFFFAPHIEQAEKMFFQNYPAGVLTALVEVPCTIS